MARALTKLAGRCLDAFMMNETKDGSPSGIRVAALLAGVSARAGLACLWSAESDKPSGKGDFPEEIPGKGLRDAWILKARSMFVEPNKNWATILLAAVGVVDLPTGRATSKFSLKAPLRERTSAFARHTSPQKGFTVKVKELN